ncbi:MAG TPA: class I SAM-dependent methyltransferase [Candidatus Limnocylindria bacterium]|nr:class I SAM-dependent methyltransferase [Candidatus Limnocylindria bacterium]
MTWVEKQLRRQARRMVTWIAAALPRTSRVERFLLQRWWNLAPADMLDSYLVSGYQNPRINIQSILQCHFLLRRLFGTEFDGVMAEELRFAVDMNERLRLRAVELGVAMGAYLDRTRAAEVRRVEEAIRGRQTEFVDRWRSLLGGSRAGPISVLELACGSANDYRAFVECGLAAFLDYRGIDLTAKNVENARRRFPGVRFEVGDVRQVVAPDASVDYVVASDIFEHLAPTTREAALGEAIRIARRGLAFTFFNMDEIPDHEIRPRGIYYWNRLSRGRIEERIRARFSDVEVVPIGRWLGAELGYRHTYNPKAYSIFAEHSRQTADPSAGAPAPARRG